MRRAPSLRARLLVLLAGATVLVGTLAVALSYADARRELNELFDAQLADSAAVLLRQSAHVVEERAEGEGAHELEHRIETPYAQRLHFQIWGRDGRLVFQSSPDLPKERLVTGVASGFADRTLHGVRWRVAVLRAPETGLEIQLCQRLDARERIAAAIARKLFVPLAAAVPVVALLVWLATGRGLRPLSAFTRDLDARSPEDLRGIPERGLPRELAPVAAALNGLLARLRTRLDLERRFTADAAHELRTPLAALRTQAQVALGAKGDEERTRALSQIVRGTDRMTHLVAQLLTLARVDPESAGAPETFDLAPLVRECAAALAPAAVERGVELEVAAADGAPIAGSRALAATLVRNLLDNAIRYVRRGDRVRAAVAASDREVVLRVTDNGPGLPPDERARAFDRFHRGASARESGSGLGLSIARRIAELHGAEIALSEPEGGGLEAVTRFPRRYPPRP